MQKPLERHDYICTLRDCLLPVKSKTIIFGDAITDRFINVKKVKKSPESPVLALETDATLEEDWAGGALNVANVMRELGMDVKSYIDEVRPRSRKVRYMYNGQCVTRVDYDVVFPEEWGDIAKSMKSSFQSMRGRRNIIIQDYGKGAINKSFYENVPPLMRDNRFYVLYGPHITTKPNRFLWPYLVKMNQEEFDKFGPKADYVFQKFNIQKYLIVTGTYVSRIYVGPENIRCIEVENPCKDMPLCPNVIGAGDIVMGILGCVDYNITMEYELAAILKIAMGVATVKCMRPYLGGSVIDMFNVFYKRYVRSFPGHPIYIRLDTYFKKFIAFEKRFKRDIIFINGSFDVLHCGHMFLLNEARRIKEMESHDDASIMIALNTDEDIKERKGKESINTLERRLLQISPFADYIFSFYGEKALEHIVKALNPDIMLKGEDYKGKRITGSRYCKEIRFVTHTGDSSSAIRKRLGK